MNKMLRSWHCWKSSLEEFTVQLVKKLFSRKEKNRFVALFTRKFKAVWGHKQYDQVTRLRVEYLPSPFSCSLSPSCFSHFPSSLSLLAPFFLLTPPPTLPSTPSLPNHPPRLPLCVILHGINFQKIMIFKVILKKIYQACSSPILLRFSNNWWRVQEGALLQYYMQHFDLK